MSDAARRITQAAEARGASVIFIDGRSGSGKTTLASTIAEQFGPNGAQILHVEDLYPGWHGLSAGAASLANALHTATYAPYDWEEEQFLGVVSFDPSLPLVVEGCGAITRESVTAAATTDTVGSQFRSRVWAVWVECDAKIRKHRALSRDGDTFRPHWHTWADQENRHFADARPVALARQIVHSDDW